MKSPVAHWGAREWRKNTDDVITLITLRGVLSRRGISDS